MAKSIALPYEVRPKAGWFSHEDAAAISKWVLRRETARTVVIDLSRVTDTTTAAFATLVVLRRKLLRRGRDLRVSGLHERARFIYAISRLDGVLPQDDAGKPSRPSVELRSPGKSGMRVNAGMSFAVASN